MALKVHIIIDENLQFRRMAISSADFWSFITELVTRIPTMGIPALEDGLFENLLIFDY